MTANRRETDLYHPIKAYLEGQGYTVKAEIGASDVVAMRNAEPPVIVELKTGFSLTLFHQAIQRLKITDHVYVAVPRWQGRKGWKAFRANLNLCRRLGLGVMSIADDGKVVEVHIDPGPYAPRQSKPHRDKLLKEFENRNGDPNLAGSTKVKLITAYRQDALRCLQVIHNTGPMKAADVATASTVKRARPIMAANHYGWFFRVSRGVYDITPAGKKALSTYQEELIRLSSAVDDNQLSRSSTDT